MRIWIVIVIVTVLGLLFPTLADAHQSGCHRWHSCPSDSGSYTCGDTGYCSGCPDNQYCKAGQPYTSYTPPKYETPQEPKTEPPATETKQPETAQPEPKPQTTIPTWIRTNAKWWAEDTIDDTTFVSAMQYLVKQDILKIPQTAQGKSAGSNQIPTWVKNNAKWWADGSIDDSSFVQGMQYLIKEGIMQVNENKSCSGNARCITGTITEIIDGDTVKVDGQSVRFALASAPELDDGGGTSARDFIKNICPVGSSALVDEDDGQTGGSYGRILGVVYCNGANLNKRLLESGFGYIISGYCSFSEFSNSLWARSYGC